MNWKNLIFTIFHRTHFGLYEVYILPTIDKQKQKKLELICMKMCANVPKLNTMFIYNSTVPIYNVPVRWSPYRREEMDRLKSFHINL